MNERCWIILLFVLDVGSLHLRGGDFPEIWWNTLMELADHMIGSPAVRIRIYFAWICWFEMLSCFVVVRNVIVEPCPRTYVPYFMGNLSLRCFCLQLPPKTRKFLITVSLLSRQEIRTYLWYFVEGFSFYSPAVRVEYGFFLQKQAATKKYNPTTTNKQTNKQTNRQASKQASKQANKQTNKQQQQHKNRSCWSSSCFKY